MYTHIYSARGPQGAGCDRSARLAGSAAGLPLGPRWRRQGPHGEGRSSRQQGGPRDSGRLAAIVRHRHGVFRSRRHVVQAPGAAGLPRVRARSRYAFRSAAQKDACLGRSRPGARSSNTTRCRHPRVSQVPGRCVCSGTGLCTYVCMCTYVCVHTRTHTHAHTSGLADTLGLPHDDSSGIFSIFFFLFSIFFLFGGAST
jgi:hypothetical protein